MEFEAMPNNRFADFQLIAINKSIVDYMKNVIYSELVHRNSLDRMVVDQYGTLTEAMQYFRL